MVGGSSAITFIQNAWTIAFAIITTILAIYYMYQDTKKIRQRPSTKSNNNLFGDSNAAFMFGYLLAAYQTHDYFESRTHHVEEECETCSIEDSKENVLLMDDNIDPIILNPINDYVQSMEKTKELLEQHATLSKEEEVKCDCPFHEQSEREK